MLLLNLLSLPTYGIMWWLIFAAVAFCTARYGFWWSVPVGHIVTAVIIYVLDVMWAQAVMQKPDSNWDGDLDMLFACGILVRVLMVNTLLLPITVLGGRGRKPDLRKLPKDYDIIP
ncbi:MAG: hypothetical protein JWN70_6544 [Planctomycetaceae bacterium]|nr:hypothetical protein [Planctomycetaceae bacterium]